MRVRTREDSGTLEVRHSQPVCVWWCGERWDIIDTPTPTWGTYEHPLITHPPTIVIGWRLIARNQDGEAYTFDFTRHGSTWELTNVWD